MKKNIFKKIVASLATVAMAAGLFTAMPAEEAKAADELYVIGDYCGWKWEKVITLTSTGGDEYKGDIVVLADTDIVIVEGGKTWDGTTKQKYIYDGSETEQKKVAFAEAGKYEMKYVKSTKAISFTLKEKLTITNEYYIAGPSDLGAADWEKWDASKATKMVKNGDKYTLETTVAKDGDYEFCVVQHSVPSIAGVDASDSWLKNPEIPDTEENRNFKATGLKAGTVKFEFNATDGKCKVTQVSVDKKDDPTQSTGETGTKGNTETTTAVADKTTTKAPETTTKKEEAKKGVAVEVTLDASVKWDKVYLYAFSGNEGLSKWPGIEMTSKDGKWYATIDTELTKLSYVISNGDKEQTADIKDVSGKDVKISVSAEKDDKGHFVASAKTVTTGGAGTAKPGDSAPIVMMFAVAAVAAGMVVATKKKTVCE